MTKKLLIHKFWRVSFFMLIFCALFGVQNAFAADNVVTNIDLLDTNANGKIDRVQVSVDNSSGNSATVHDNAGWSATDGGSGVDISAVALSSAADANPLVINIDLNESDTDLTVDTLNADLEIIYAQQGTNDTGTEYNDTANTQLVAIATGDSDTTDTENDKAAPVIKEFKYEDNNDDGYVDQFIVYFSETVDATSALAPKDLNLTGVGDFTSASFGGSASDTITGNVSQATVVLGTASSVKDTNEGSGTIAISSQGSFSLTDVTNTNNTLGAQTQATFTDGAAPVLTAANGNSGLDTIALTFSENVWDSDDTVLDTGDFGISIVAGAQTISSVTHTAGSSTATLTLSDVLNVDGTDMEGGNDTINLTASVQDDANNSAGTAGVLIADVDIPTFASAVASDNNGDGTVDTLTVNFSESIDLTDSNTTTAGIPGLSLDVCAFDTTDYTSNNVMQIVFTLTGCTVNDTSVTPTITYDAGGLSEISDQNGAEIANSGNITATDGAGPVVISANGNVGTNTVDLTFSENVYNATGSPASPAGDLAIDDFTLVDTDNGRAITNVSHAANSNTATITLDSVLDDTTDIGTDTLAFAAASAYDASDNANATTAKTFADNDNPTIANTYYIDDNFDGTVDFLKIVFSEYIDDSSYHNTGATLSVIGTSLDTTALATPTNETDTADDNTIYLAIAGATANTTYYAGANFDTLEANLIDDFSANPLADDDTNAVGDQAKPIVAAFNGNVGSNSISLTFSENVYNAAGSPGGGSLEIADFAIVDTDNSRTISGVTHAAGTASATLTLNAALDSSNDINTDTIAFAADSAYDASDNANATTTETLLDVDIPTITNTYYIDDDGDGTVDFLKIVLSEYVNDSSYHDTSATISGIGTLSTGMLGSPTVDVANDDTIYLTITGATADTTHYDGINFDTVAGSMIQDFSLPTPNTLADDPTNTVDDGAGPAVKLIHGDAGLDTITLQFTENVYDTDNSALDIDDFGITMTGGQTITANDHPGSGQDFAILTLSSVLNVDGTDYDGDDTINLTANIQDASDNSAKTTSVTIIDTLFQTLTSSTADTNGDGTIDQIVVNFVESVDIVDGNGATAGMPGITLTDGCTIDATDYSDTNTMTLVLGVTGCTTSDTSITPSLTYDADGLSSVLDQGGNEITDEANINISDSAGPAILSAIAADNTNDIDTIDDDDTVVITFSENTNQPAINAGNIDTVLALNNTHSWLDGDSAITSATWTTASTLTVTLLDGTSDPTIATADTVTLNGTTITDGTNNSTTIAFSSITGSFEDTTAPTMIGLSTADDDSDGTIEKLVATFDEDLADANVSATGFTVSDGCTTIDSVSETAAGVLTFVLSGCTAGDTSITPDLAYDDSTGTITDNASANNALATFAATNSTDGAKPVVLSVTYSENPANAGAMTVTANLSENVSGGADPTISIDQQGTTDISDAAMTDSGDGKTFTYEYTVNTHNGTTYKNGTAYVGFAAASDGTNTMSTVTTASHAYSFVIQTDGVQITGYTVSNLSSTGATITWTTNEVSTSSMVDFYSDGAQSLNQVATISGGGTTSSITVSNLTANTQYHILLKSMRDGQASFTSLPISITTASSATGISVDSVQMTQTYASANNTYASGWKWKFNVTINDLDENMVAMKFSEWTGVGSATIDSASNVQYSLDNATWTNIDVNDTYGSQINAGAIDNNTNLGGRQVTIYVQMKVPNSTTGGNYGAQYGIETTQVH